MKRKRAGAGLALGVVAVLGLSACANNVQASAPDAAGEQTLVVNTTQGFGYTSLLKAENIQVDGVAVEYITSTEEVDPAIASGSVHLDDTGDIGPITARGSGGKNVAVACTQPNTELNHYLVKKDSGIDSFEDLVGKKVALHVQSNHGLLYERLLNENSLTEDDVEVVDISGPEALNALLTDQVDAYSALAPAALDHLKKHPDLVSIEGIEGNINNRYCLYTNENTLESHQEALRAYLGAVQETALWAAENPEEAAQTVVDAGETEYDVGTLAQTFAASGAGYQPFDESFYAEQQQFAAELVDVGFLDEEVDVHEVFVDDFQEVFVP
ncbi:ABC transporter substrate-binding protein [Cellulosimicrobium funkei]|nr:ABC transporter substrate-binding protein [Cellulosimicrobium funkei]